MGCVAWPLGQVDLALELLGDGNRSGTPDERAVHETRKAIKRLRALLGMLRQELGERSFQRENATLRDLADQLAGARDATVMLATLDALVARYERQLGRRHGVLALRRRLADESARMQRATLADANARAALLGELHALRWRIAAWSLPASPGMRLVDGDLERLYRQGRARRGRVLHGKGERTVAMHRWRKRVKDLRYAAEILERRGARGPGKPGGSRESRRSGKHERPDRRLRELAARADDLAELLGEEHDLAVLAQHLRAGTRLRPPRGKDARRRRHVVAHPPGHPQGAAEADRQTPAQTAPPGAAPG